jgi:hypothetical protein
VREWIVDAADAFARWVQLRQPDAGREFAMLLWLFDLERDGPPSIIGFSARWNPIARGPHEERIEFSVLALPLTDPPEPPWAFISIHAIT